MSDELVPEVDEEVAEKKRTRRVKEALIVIEHGVVRQADVRPGWRHSLGPRRVQHSRDPALDLQVRRGSSGNDRHPNPLRAVSDSGGSALVRGANLDERRRQHPGAGERHGRAAWLWRCHHPGAQEPDRSLR